MASELAPGVALSGAKRPRGRPSKPDHEKERARMWRCTIEPCTDDDRDKLKLCGADKATTKRFAVRRRGDRLEALFSFEGSAKSAAQLQKEDWQKQHFGGVLQASWHPLPMTEYLSLVQEFDEGRDDTHPGVASSVAVSTDAEQPTLPPHGLPESDAPAPPPQLPPPPSKAPRYWTSLADAIGQLRAEMGSEQQQEAMQLPTVDPRVAIKKSIRQFTRDDSASKYEINHEYFHGHNHKTNSWEWAIARIKTLKCDGRLEPGTPWLVAASHNGVDETQGSDFVGFEFALTAFLHVLYCIVYDVTEHCSLPLTPENHLLPKTVACRSVQKALMKPKMFASIMCENQLLQSKYLLARMVLNCQDSVALRCLCLCEPDVVLSDPDGFVDTVYDDKLYDEPWSSLIGGRKEISVGLHLRCRYRCSMYSEFLYGAMLMLEGRDTRAKVSHLDELLQWAEARAAANKIYPAYLGGAPAPPIGMDAEEGGDHEAGTHTTEKDDQPESEAGSDEDGTCYDHDDYDDEPFGPDDDFPW